MECGGISWPSLFQKKKKTMKKYAHQLQDQYYSTHQCVDQIEQVADLLDGREVSFPQWLYRTKSLHRVTTWIVKKNQDDKVYKMIRHCMVWNRHPKHRILELMHTFRRANSNRVRLSIFYTPRRKIDKL